MQSNSSSSIAAAPPAAIGRYRLLTRIASGGMGAVYLAETDWVPGSPPKRVALKVLHAHHGEDEEITARFVDEGRVAGRIVHPNVVQVLDAGRTDDLAFMALEYVPGDTIAGLLRACAARGTTIPLGIVSSIAAEFLEGLHAAHGATDDAGHSIGLVHRDVSPQNILVGIDGHAYVTDFGVAKVKDRIRATRSGSMIGKTGYMAPEQVAGGVVSAKTDLYAAGIVLWECLVGAKLFDGLEAQIQAAVTRAPPASVRSRRGEIPEAIDELVAELLQHAPDRRPSDAHAVAQRLTAALVPASREEVAAWIGEIVGPKLQERERKVEAWRAALADGASLADLSGETSGVVESRAETKAEAAVAASVRPRTHRTWAATVAALAIMGIVGVVVGFGRGASSYATRGLRVGRAVSTAPHTDSTPALPALDVALAPSAAPASAAPVSASPPSTAPAPKPVGVAPVRPSGSRPAKPRSAGCSPPYVIENGIKRYKAECFGGNK